MKSNGGKKHRGLVAWGSDVVRKIDSYFIDRQVLIRSEGSVKYINIPRPVQMSGAATLAGVMVIAAWSLGTIMVQEVRLADRERTIEKTNLAYSSVVEEMTAAQRRFVDLATQIQDEQSRVIALLEERSTTREILTQMDLYEITSNEAGLSKADLLRRLEEIESELVLAYNKDSNTSRLASLQQLADSNNAQSVQALVALETNLNDDLQLLGDRDTMRRYMRAAEIKLRSALEERDTAQAEGDALSDKYLRSERRIAALKAAQQEFVEQLELRTNAQLASLENTIQDTGLDPAVLLTRYTRTHMGQGGPAPDDPVRVAALNAVDGLTLDLGTETQIATLERKLDKWTALHEIVRDLPLSSPVDYYYVSSRYGKRRDPFTGKPAMHRGIDMAASLKSPILASAPGIVTFAGRKGAYGRLVEIDHGNGLRTRYGHLHAIKVKKGQEVTHRERIGLMGSTGRSTGSHLHYEIIFDDQHLDPAPFIRAGRSLLRG